MKHQDCLVAFGGPGRDDKAAKLGTNGDLSTLEGVSSIFEHIDRQTKHKISYVVISPINKGKYVQYHKSRWREWNQDLALNLTS